jgi:hypothetical protein
VRGVFWVPLDNPSAEVRYQLEGSGQGRSGCPAAAVALPDETARDPPIRERGSRSLVRRAALDPGKLVRRTELTPADAHVAVEDERRVRGPALYPVEFARAVDLRVRPLPGPLWVESHAPAPTEDPVVLLDERRERGPRGLVECGGRVRR